MPDRLVYSTDGGRIHTCPTCGQPYKRCSCDQSTTSQTAPKKSDGIVRVMRDRKHRGGKTVTVISGYI
jgi:translation initiation factor 1